jgi:acetoin utilization deacetylase AcuC-like enzyme
MQMHAIYDERMVAKTSSYSPSASKPAAVVKDWLDRKLPVRLHSPRAATREQLCRAHDSRYVDGILSCELENGFGNRDADVARSLPWTVGAMTTAAHLAIQHPARIACAPVSGFHHAHWGHAAGFCTFNGLMVAALDVLAQGLVDNVWIVDCDHHFGDGTEDILYRLPTRDRERIHHATAGFELTGTDQAERAIAFASKAAERAKRHPSRHERKLVLYQAGADQHIDDPLGGILTTEELRRRDQGLFRICRMYGIPLAWNLAGGYQKEVDGSIPRVLEIHRNTMLQATEGLPT